MDLVQHYREVGNVWELHYSIPNTKGWEGNFLLRINNSGKCPYFGHCIASKNR